MGITHPRLLGKLQCVQERPGALTQEDVGLLRSFGSHLNPDLAFLQHLQLPLLKLCVSMSERDAVV